MIIANLNFFDKFGKNLNLDWDSDLNIWKGTIFFDEVSAFLYDNENIFILEKDDDLYKFPMLSEGDVMRFKWEDNAEDRIFLYEVERDFELNNFFMAPKEEVSVSYEDVIHVPGSGTIDLSLPLQVNIAFNPEFEQKYERKLCVYIQREITPDELTRVAEISFYGEGVEEDERFGVWARNFGIRFNKEDANILKDYDVKEAFPDVEQLNTARKSLLVNRDQVYPYIGTYKGLINFINLMGYKDVLHVKEYWDNVNKSSMYYGKKTLIDITDFLDDGVIDNINVLDRNKNIKFGKQFKKTEFLALVYEFTRASDTYDDDGVPIVEETTTFTVDEMFYKLNKLKDKLKNEIIPINVQIKDIIGEFIYFQKITIKFWKDNTKVFDFNLNEYTKVESYPDPSHNFIIRKLSPLFRRDNANGIDHPLVMLNNGLANPYEWNQKYPIGQLSGIIDYVKDFYTEIKNQSFPDIGKRLSWEDGDDPELVIGAPAVFNIYIDRFTFENFKGVTFEDLQGSGLINPYYTLQNLDFGNFYEITWKISKIGNVPYNFEWRGKVVDLYQIPHFLPYVGEYRVTAELHDFYGNTSVFSKIIEVQSDIVPDIIATVRLDDKFNYQISNLSNVRLQDFGSSYHYLPKVAVLDADEEIGKIDVDKNLQQWTWFYKNKYGMGQNLYDVELWDTISSEYVPYTDPSQRHPKLEYWGLGGGTFPVRLEDLKDMTIDSLFHTRICDLVYNDDFNAGFYLQDPKEGDIVKISGFSEYAIPTYSTLEELVDILNESNHPGIKLFNYEIINGRESDNQFIIHAQAEYLSKEMYHIISNTKLLSNKWYEQTSGTEIKLNDICFINENLGWACGNDGIILYTIDGGLNWSQTVIDTGLSSNELNNIQFVDENIGFVSPFDTTEWSEANYMTGGTSNNSLFKTTDGGLTWSNIETNVSTFHSVNENLVIWTSFFPPEGGQYMGITRDGFATTERFYIFINNDVAGIPVTIQYIDDNNIWMLLTTGIVKFDLDNATYPFPPNGVINGDNKYATGDTYIGWFPSGSTAVGWSDNLELLDLYFMDINNAWACGINGTVIKTTDAGETWTNINIDTDEKLTSVKFIDSNNGIACGDGGSIFRTTDGGITWVNEYVHDQGLTSVSMPALENIWISGDIGTIISASTIYPTDKYTFFIGPQIYSDKIIDLLKSQSDIFDDETLFLVAKTSDLLNGNVQDPNFWISNKHWKFQNDKQEGHLPTVLDQNSFDINQIKVFKEDFTIPENITVFFNVNNIDGKYEYIWTLYDYYTGEEIVRTRSVPFFVWKFKDQGRFTIKVDIYDNNGNLYTKQADKFINVLDKSQYITYIEKRLNRRKYNLLK